MKKRVGRCRKLCKSKQMSNKMEVDWSLLPDHLFLEIFQKLPTHLLRHKAKYTCKRWFDLITNKILLDHVSLILEAPGEYRKVRVMGIREENEGLEMKDRYLDLWYGGRVKSWCNECLLITDFDNEGSLYNYNLSTREGSFLPSCSIPCGGHFGCKCGMGLSYDKFKGVYKVVHVFNGPPIQSELLICGSSNWEKIDGPFFTGQRKYYWDDPVSIQGCYFHWDVHSCKYLVSMDTVEEVFYNTYLPETDDFPANNRYTFAEMGGFLTLLHKISWDKINIWMLKDARMTIWEKFHTIYISSDVRSSIYPGSILPRPVTSVKGQRYLIFRKPAETGLYSYDMENRFMERLDFDIAPEERCVVRSRS